MRSHSDIGLTSAGHRPCTFLPVYTGTVRFRHSCKTVIHISYIYSQLNSSEHGSEVKNDVLKAFIELLPSTINSESSGGVHWFFTLLTGMLTTEDLNGAGKSCMELLMRIAQQLDSKLTYHDRVLRAR